MAALFALSLAPVGMSAAAQAAPAVLLATRLAGVNSLQSIR